MVYWRSRKSCPAGDSSQQFGYLRLKEICALQRRIRPQQSENCHVAALLRRNLLRRAARRRCVSRGHRAVARIEQNGIWQHARFADRLGLQCRRSFFATRPARAGRILCIQLEEKRRRGVQRAICVQQLSAGAFRCAFGKAQKNQLLLAAS